MPAPPPESEPAMVRATDGPAGVTTMLPSPVRDVDGLPLHDDASAGVAGAGADADRRAQAREGAGDRGSARGAERQGVVLSASERLVAGRPGATGTRSSRMPTPGFGEVAEVGGQAVGDVDHGAGPGPRPPAPPERGGRAGVGPQQRLDRPPGPRRPRAR